MKLLFGIFLFLLPFAVLGWAIATNKSKKQLVKYTLIAALIFGTVLQFLFEAHAHVPGSGIMLFLFEILSSAIALIIYLGINFLYKKFNSTGKVDP